MSAFDIRNTVLEIDTLTPVHIGNGDKINRFDYYVDVNTNSFIRMNVLKFILSLPEKTRRELIDIDYSKPLEVIKKYEEIYSKNPDAVREARIWVSGYSPGFLRKIKNSDKDLSMLEVKTHIRTGEKLKPIIPGSSIKGSIATALFYHLKINQKLEIRKFRNMAEKACLGQNSTDSVGRLFKISDTILDHSKTKSAVFVVKNIKKTEERGGNLDQMVECIYESKSNHQVTFLNIPIKFPLDLRIDENLIVKVCNLYYRDGILDEQVKYLKKKRQGSSFISLIEQQLEKIKSDDKAFLLLIGWGSGAEAVTMFSKKSSTKWVVYEGDQYYPLGWCVARFSDSK